MYKHMRNMTTITNAIHFTKQNFEQHSLKAQQNITRNKKQIVRASKESINIPKKKHTKTK